MQHGIPVHGGGRGCQGHALGRVHGVAVPELHPLRNPACKELVETAFRDLVKYGGYIETLSPPRGALKEELAREAAAALRAATAGKGDRGGGVDRS